MGQTPHEDEVFEQGLAVVWTGNRARTRVTLQVIGDCAFSGGVTPMARAGERRIFNPSQIGRPAAR